MILIYYFLLFWHQLCDYKAQCAYGEDERYCGTCNFAEDTCGWRSVEVSEDDSHLWWQRTGEDGML